VLNRTRKYKFADKQAGSLFIHVNGKFS